MSESISPKDLLIQVADDLGCHLAFTTSDNSSNTVVDHDTLTVESLRDYAVDETRFRHWYAALDSDLSTFRLVKSTGLPSEGTLVMTRPFEAQVDEDVAGHLFMVLDPPNWLLALNNGLRDKFLPMRFAVPFSDESSEYNLTQISPWLRSIGQILRLRARDDTTPGSPVEAELSRQYLFENEGEVTLQLPNSYLDRQNQSLIVEARRYYDPVTSYTTPMIQMVNNRLIRAACKREALLLIFHTLGQSARQRFGQQMVVTEKELIEQESKHLATTVKRDWTTEGDRISGDPQLAHSWGW